MKTWKLFCALVLCTVAITSLCFCGGGGSSTSPAPTTNYNASAAAGDYIKLTVDLNDGSYSYENVTTGRNEVGTVTEDPTTKELTFTATTSTGGGSGDGSASELITGFIAPNTGIVLLANYTGAGDITSMIFGVPHRNHVPSDLINLVPTGSTANYIYMQFRTLDAGFEIGYMDLMGNQPNTDAADLDNDGSDIDTINGAPIYGELYSTVSGASDPNIGVPLTIFSEDVINPTYPLADQVPFVEAASDGSHLIHRAWEDVGGGKTVVEKKMFFNSTLNKVITDNEFGTAILLERSGDSSWSANYEGTYYIVEYNGQGVLGGISDTFDSVGTLVFEISNDGSGSGLISIVGSPYQNKTLASFQDLESAGLLGEVITPWPDGTPIDGVFGFTVPPDPLVDPNDLGQEFFFIFSEGVVFFVEAQLTGPRDSSGGEVHNYPASYTYSYGGGLKIQ